jgi:hypothetical protein
MMTRDDIIEAASKAGFDTKRDMIWVDQWEITPALTRFAALVAAAERTRACRIVTGLCISDNNAREINEAICAQGQRTSQHCAVSDRLARHGIQLPEEDDHDGNPSF